MPETPALPFFSRLWIAVVCFFRTLLRPGFASQIQSLLHASGSNNGNRVTLDHNPNGLPPEELHASGLFFLSMLQREGRFLDFLQEDVAAFTDAEVGAATRVVHEGCRKVVFQYLSLKPVLPDPEGSTVTVPLGFDPQRVRLTGNVAGQPPFKGSLKHHGWVTGEIKLPAVPATLDLKVLAPAEVEL